jgi:polyhydroxyalkanoate synthesis regulator phasin
MSISSIHNNNYVNLKTNFVTQSQDTENSSYILKSVLSQTSSDRLSSQIDNIVSSSKFIELKEELSKLEKEVNKLQRQVGDLEKSKMIKVTKVLYILF